MPKLNLLRFSLLWPLWVVILIWHGCKQEDDDSMIDPCIIDPTSCDTTGNISVLNFEWIVSKTPDTAFAANWNIGMSQGGIVSNIVELHSKKLMLSDFENGQQIFEWAGLQSSHYSTMSIHHELKIAIVQYAGNLATISLNTGQSVNEHVLPSGSVSNPFGQLLGDYYYFSRTNPSKTSAWIVRSHINDFSTWETVYTIHTNDVGGSRPNIQSYNLWTDPETGDEILVFQHRMAFPSRVDVVAYNMTQGEVIWQHDDLTALGNSNHQQIFILDDKAYFSGATAYYCFDIPTGEIVWQYDHPSGINSFLYYKTVYAENENLIIVKDAGTRLYAFHPLTGSIVWVTEGAGQSASGAGSPSYHDGIIYYTGMFDWTMRLLAIRASNGQLLYAERSRLHYHSQFNGPVAIDPERRVLYASDHYYLMAIKLYED